MRRYGTIKQLPNLACLLRALRASSKEELAVQIESIQKENPSCFHEFPATQFPPLSDKTSRTHEYKTPPTSKMLEDTMTEASARMYPIDNPIQVPSCRVVRKEDPVPVRKYKYEACMTILTYN